MEDEVGCGVGIYVCVGITACAVIELFEVRCEGTFFQNAVLVRVIEPSTTRMALSTITIIIRLLIVLESRSLTTLAGTSGVPII